MRDLTDFRSRFEPEFDAFLSARRTEFEIETQDPSIGRYVAHAVALATGGKRVRPYLCALAYYGAGGTSDEVTTTLGIGLECFQMFCLLQDDVIDRATLRHNVTALHGFVANDITGRSGIGDATHVGEGQAMLLADLYFSWSQSCVYGVLPGVSQQDQARIGNEYRKMTRRVIAGQMLDVDFTTREKVSENDVTTKMRLKTSGYSFVSPLAIGFAAAGASQEAHDWAVRFGEALGGAFQLQDDLLDIYRDSKETGKPILGDLREGQRTFLTQYVDEHGDTAARTALHAMLGNSSFSDQRAATDLFTSSGAKAACDERIRQGFILAGQHLAEAPMNMTAIASLAQLVHALRSRS